MPPNATGMMANGPFANFLATNYPGATAAGPPSVPPKLYSPTRPRGEMPLPVNAAPFPYIPTEVKIGFGLIPLIPEDHPWCLELAARNIYEPEQWKYWRTMKVNRHSGPIVDLYEKLCDDKRLLTWPLPWPFEAKQAFKQRQLEENARVDADIMETQWEWREAFDRRLSYARWSKSKLRKDKVRDRPSPAKPSPAQQSEDSYSPATEPLTIPEGPTRPQTPPLPPSLNGDLLLPPRLDQDERMKFGAAPQNLRRTFSNKPKPHSLAPQLESRGYYEPEIWQFWRANPAPRDSELPDRHTRLSDAQKHPFVRYWPLPLPYETYAEFKLRQEQIKGRPLSARQTRAAEAQMAYRETKDQRLRARSPDSIEAWMKKLNDNKLGSSGGSASQAG